MLDEALKETDPETTDVIVLKAKLVYPDQVAPEERKLDVYDRELMTAVVDHAERAGKEIHPVVVPTNHPLDAILRAARALKVQQLVLGAGRNLRIQEVVLGTSRRRTPQQQLQLIAKTWAALHEGHPTPLSVCLVAPGRSVHMDLSHGIGSTY
jgi:hypothetical protein